MVDWDHSRPWYHGSPLKLKVLRKRSTITQDRDLARIFSHKPTIVSISDRGMKHDGSIPGFLYQIAEEIRQRDIYPHPRSAMEEGKEWLTARELRVELIGLTQVAEEEKLTDEELERLRKRAESERKHGQKEDI